MEQVLTCKCGSSVWKVYADRFVCDGCGMVVSIIIEPKLNINLAKMNDGLQPLRGSYGNETEGE